MTTAKNVKTSKGNNGASVLQEKFDESADAISTRLATLEAELRESGDRLLTGAKEIVEATRDRARTHPIAAVGAAFVAGMAVARLLRR